MQVLTSLLTRPPIRVAAMGVVIVLAVAACGSGAVEAPSSAPPRSVTTTADGPLVQQLTNAVAETGAMQHMQALQKIADENGGNRAAGTAGYGASVDYVVGVLRDAGFEASTPTYQASGDADEGDSAPGRNVIAQTRSGDPARVVMIGAHLDSVPEGPGIVDNGSGVASLLEIATKLGPDPSANNAVRFAFFDNEESGAVGSSGYLEGLPEADRQKIKLYLNVDMVASPNGGYFRPGRQGR